MVHGSWGSGRSPTDSRTLARHTRLPTRGLCPGAAGGFSSRSSLRSDEQFRKSVLWRERLWSRKEIPYAVEMDPVLVVILKAVTETLASILP